MPYGLRQLSLPSGALFRQLKSMLCGGQLEPKLAQLSLPAEAPVLRSLDLIARGLELVLRRFRHLARLR